MTSTRRQDSHDGRPAPFPRHRFARLVILIALYCSVLQSVSAHPHVFMEASLTFESDGKIWTGLWVEWRFDVVFSAGTIMQFDHDGDGSFDVAETVQVRQKAFSNLKKYGYFTFIRQGEKRFAPSEAESFSARQENGILVYRFRIPLDNLDPDAELYIAAFDTTFYCDIKYTDSPVTFSMPEPAGSKPEFSITENKKYPVYYDPKATSGDTGVFTTWRKGLETAWPREVRVWFP